jgi:ADP-ribose pyrophosphatase YjhB (NUDIX family)
MAGILSTDPNCGIPIGYRAKIAQDVGAEATKHAAGIVFVAPDGDILLLRRAGTPGVDNYVGHWSLPGGGVDQGETPPAGAVREAKEEMGVDVDPGALKPLDRRVTPTGMAFHTFAHPAAEKFTPTLNEEHSGYAWSSLDMLPRPLHPAVEQTLREQVGMADDMTPEDWTGLRDGFLKWISEEESETEHAGATDSALVLAFDRASVRTVDDDGHLHVSQSNISKANVSPYRGSEIPQFKELGLDPDRIYQLLRDPDELKKSAESFNGKPLLLVHRPMSAKDHAPQLVVGSIFNPVYDHPYLKAELVVWPEQSIKEIENDTKKEISCGYRYVAVMEPGVFEGQRFDGRMVSIKGNHVSLVVDGRVPGAVVGDSDVFAEEWKIVERAILDIR